MRPRRIICTVTTDLTYDQRMQRICTTLAGAGYRVTLVGRELPQSLPFTQQNYTQHRLRCRYHGGKLFYLEYNWRLYRWLIEQDFDAICAVDLDTLWAAARAVKVRGGRLVYDAHEYFTETPEVVRRPAVQRAWAGLADRYLPRVAAAYTVSEGLAELLTARYRVPFGVVRNIAVANPVTAVTAMPRFILYQGALNEGRGLPELLHAVTALPELHLRLAGEGDLSDELRQLTQQLKLSGRVHFLGYVTPDRLPALTASAWLGYNLLEDRGLSYRYSLANKTFDYYRAGLPALHSSLPEYIRLAERHGGVVLVDRLRPENIVAAVRSLLLNTNLYQQLQQESAAAGRVLTWENEAPRLLDIYASVFASSSSAK